MLNRTLLFSVIALLLFGTPSFVAAADGKTFSFQIDNAVILGQQSEARKGPSLGDQLRRMFDKILPSDDTTDNRQRQQPVVAPPAVPIQPPKPPTAVEIQQFTNTPNQRQPQISVNTSNSSSRVSSASPIFRNITDEGSEDSETPTHVRLQIMRDAVFSNPDVEKAAIESRAREASQNVRRTPTLTSSSPLRDGGNNLGGIVGDSGDFADFSALQRMAAASSTGEAFPEVFAPLNYATQQTIPRMDQQVAHNQMPDPFRQPRQQQQQFAAVETEPRRDPSRQLITSISPRLDLVIEQPPSAVVGEEVVYRIRATNPGEVPVERVVLNAEIPPWVIIRHTDADNGNWVVYPRNDGSGISDLEWRVNRIDPGETNLLALWLVSQLPRTIELPIQHDFHRPPIVAKVELQEPKLVMELVGPDEVRWNDLVVYTLVIRNVGNGSAEKLRFELVQTSAEKKATEMEEPLLPGDGREIPIEVRAGREQEHLDIAIVALGAHDLKSEVNRRIRVLRPRLEMSVQTSPLHFVDEPAEMLIRVVNNGNADAENITIRAELPLGAIHETSSEGGLFVQQQQQNIVEWRGRFIGKGEMQTFSLTCRPRREGECRISVAASEPAGSILASSNGTFMAEAVVELDLVVQKPNGPIELGQEVTYTIEVTNIGTKAAEEVEISMMFDERLEPTAVAGREAKSTPNGQVFFEKIPTILPKQTEIVKVSVEAKGIGTAQIRAEVIRADASGGPIRLEQGLSANIFSRQRGASTASGRTTQQ